MFVVKPTQKVRVGIETQSGQILQFYSYIKKIESDRLLLVFSEAKSNLVKYLQEGKLIRISIYTPAGIILQESIIMSEPKNCEFEVEFGGRTKRIQRRRFFRVDANYRMILEQVNQTYTVLTKDISGGGVRFICDSYIYHGETNAKLYIPDEKKPISFIGRVDKKPHFSENEYIIKFVDISENDRNKVIQKCMEIEAKNIREN